MAPPLTEYEINVLEKLESIRHSLEYLSESLDHAVEYFTGECDHGHVLPPPKEEPDPDA